MYNHVFLGKMSREEYLDKWIDGLRKGFNIFLERKGIDVEKLSRKEILDKRLEFELDYFHVKNINANRFDSNIPDPL